MGFSSREYWGGLPFPSPGALPDPGIEPGSPTLEADALTSEPPGEPICKELTNWKRPDSGKDEGRRRRGGQRMRWLDGITT